ncbi:MAG: hypothetical protein WBB31_19525, partial [Saprospiraceae bacterium]
MLKIDLKDKFTSIHFENILSQYYLKSQLDKSIEFDLSKLEWIGIEQTTFLISWINSLAQKSTYISIKLPDLADSPTKSQKTNRLKCLNYLINHWNFLSLLNKSVQSIGDTNAQGKLNQELPYQPLEVIKYNAKTFDSDFSYIYESKLNHFVSYIKTEINDNTFLNYFDNHFLHYSIIKE